jgi:hypothetical protein
MVSKGNGPDKPTNPQAAPAAGPAVASAYLKALWPDPPPSHFWQVWRKRDVWGKDGKSRRTYKRTHWVPTSDPGGVARVVGAYAGWDVYLAVGLSATDNGPRRRNTADEVVVLPGLFFDLDFGKEGHAGEHYPPSAADALGVAQLWDGDALGGPPSLLCSTGHGFAVWWLFPERWVLDTLEKREAAAALVRDWQEVLRRRAAERGWDVDNTSDLARVLRLAGGVNHKGDPVPVECGFPVASCHYTPEYLRALCDKLLAATAGAAPAGGAVPPRASPGAVKAKPVVPAGVPAAGERVPAQLLLQRAHGRAAAGRRNKEAVWLGCQLRDNNYGLDEALPVATAYAECVRTLGDHAYTPAEAAATFRSVYKRARRAPWKWSPPRPREEEGKPPPPEPPPRKAPPAPLPDELCLDCRRGLYEDGTTIYGPLDRCNNAFECRGCLNYRRRMEAERFALVFRRAGAKGWVGRRADLGEVRARDRALRKVRAEGARYVEPLGGLAYVMCPAERAAALAAALPGSEECSLADLQQFLAEDFARATPGRPNQSLYRCSKAWKRPPRKKSGGNFRYAGTNATACQEDSVAFASALGVESQLTLSGRPPNGPEDRLPLRVSTFTATTDDPNLYHELLSALRSGRLPERVWPARAGAAQGGAAQGGAAKGGAAAPPDVESYLSEGGQGSTRQGRFWPDGGTDTPPGRDGPYRESG